MAPEDKEEFKILIREVLKEEEQTISPVFKIIQVYKDVEISEQDKEIKDPLLVGLIEDTIDSAETIKVYRTFKWSQLYNIIETSKTERDLFEVKQLYKLILDSGTCIYVVIKDIKEFESAWEEAILAYGFI